MFVTTEINYDIQMSVRRLNQCKYFIQWFHIHETPCRRGEETQVNTLWHEGPKAKTKHYKHKNKSHIVIIS